MRLVGAVTRVHMRNFDRFIPRRKRGEGQSVWGTGITAHSEKNLEKIQTFLPFSASDCCMPSSDSISLPTSIAVSFSFSGSAALPAFLFPVQFSGENRRATKYGRKKLNILRSVMCYERL